MELNLEQVDLHPALQKYLELDREPFQMLRHPLVYGVPYAPPFNSMYNDLLKQKIEQIDRAIAERNWSQYIWLHERPHRIQALDDLYPQIPDADFWALFGDVYTDSENIHQNHDTVERWLDTPVISKNTIMHDDELEEFYKLPAVVTVYRGYNLDSNIETPADWSWSLSADTAEWFANRFGCKGVVIKGTVQRNRIIALFNRRSEQEVLVWAHDVEDKEEI